MNGIDESMSESDLEDIGMALKRHVLRVFDGYHDEIAVFVCANIIADLILAISETREQAIRGALDFGTMMAKGVDENWQNLH